MALDDLRVQHVPAAAKHHLCAGLQLLSGMHERFPAAFSLKIRKEQALNRAAGRIARADQSRWKDFRVVNDEQITLAEELCKPRDAGVLDCTCCFVKDKQPGGGALRLRRLRDEFGRQIEAEI
jgi:hypothetical protein